MAAARRRPARTVPDARRPAAATRPWAFVLIGAAVLAVAVLVVLALTPKAAIVAAPTAAAARPVPSSPPTAVPITSAPTPTPDGTPRPASCDELYSPSMVKAMGDLVLNPDWGTAPGATAAYGTDDAQLRGIIDTGDKLSCLWGAEAGASDAGIVTDIVWVTQAVSGAVKARLNEAGLRCYEERGGVRCLLQQTSGSGMSGESHFLRADIWLATKYANAGPDGYTHDIVDSLWNGA